MQNLKQKVLMFSLKPNFNCTFVLERELKNVNRAETELLLNVNSINSEI